MKNTKTIFVMKFLLSAILLFLIGFTGCVKRFPRLKTEPDIKGLEGIWVNDKTVSTQEIGGNFTIKLLPNNTAQVINLPVATPSKMSHHILFIDGESKWEIYKRSDSWDMLLNKPNSNEWLRFYLERDSNDIVLTYYINPNWPNGIVFRKQQEN